MPGLASGGVLPSETPRLRFMQSVGGKACPSGEQITNGGFETGDFTGWTHSDVDVYADGHSGSYYCGIWRGGYIEQDLASPVPVECFVVTSVFSFYERHEYGGCVAEATRARVTITYTDDSTTEVNFEWFKAGPGPDYTDWAVINLKPYLEAGKTVKSIKFEHLSTSSAGHWRVDDVSCVP